MCVHQEKTLDVAEEQGSKLDLADIKGPSVRQLLHEHSQELPYLSQYPTYPKNSG